VCFSIFCYPPGWSELTPDDSDLTKITHNGHLRGWGYKYPLTLSLSLSLSLFSPDQLSFKSIHSFTLLHPKARFLQGLTYGLRGSEIWELVCEHLTSFRVFISRSTWSNLDSSIRVLYSWSFAPRRLEVPVSSHSFVVEPPEVCIFPSLCESNSKWLNPPTWLIGRGKRVIGQPCSLWAPQRRRSSFRGVNFGINLVSPLL